MPALLTRLNLAPVGREPDVRIILGQTVHFKTHAPPAIRLRPHRIQVLGFNTRAVFTDVSHGTPTKEARAIWVVKVPTHSRRWIHRTVQREDRSSVAVYVPRPHPTPRHGVNSVLRS